MIRALPVAVVAVLAATLSATPAAAVSGAPRTAGASCEVSAATLAWGFKESFRAYIDGSIANGEWQVADGATYATPEFGFTASGPGTLDPREPSGQVDFAGSIRFTGHGGILDTTVANPRLVVGADASLLLLDVSGPTMEGDAVDVSAVPFVEVDLSGQDLTPVDGVIAIDAAPTTLTADGALAFPNYEAVSEFDPVTVRLEVGDCALAPEPTASPEPTPEPTPEAVPVGLLAGGVAALAALAAVIVAVVLVRRRRA